MQISLEWLRQYVDYNDGAEQLSDLLTRAGFEVEEVEAVGDDWVLSIEITSNRPDCLGHIGIAREVAAVTGAELKLPSVDYAEAGKDVTEWTSVANEAEDLCGRYTARVIDGVKVGASPDWMVRRLAAVGIRSINNVVDITNYVMMEVGQPLHSFDYEQLAGGKIIVRRAKQGEKMEMIDHSMVELTDKMLVIADAEKPVALAGVMGGVNSEVADTTKTILMESAHFEPLSVRSTSRALTLGSESSFRFERTVDIVTADWASRRATALLVELADGKAAPGVIDVWPTRWEELEVTMRLARLERLLGIKVPDDEVMEILTGLGLQPRLADGVVTCIRPSWRSDITREPDLIEEVIRIYGFENIPTEENITITVTTPDAYQRTRANVTNTLLGCGYYETISVGFIDDGHIGLFAAEGYEPVRVKDFTRKSNNALRHSLLPALMAARQRNQAVGNGHCDFYELAAVHEPDSGNVLPKETISLGLLTDGSFQELRGVIEAIVSGLDKHATVSCEPTDDLVWAADGCGAVVKVNGQAIGTAGKMSEKILKAFDLENDVCGAEIRFAELIPLESNETKLEPLARFPGITRDLSLVLDESVAWAQVEKVVREQKVADLRQLEFVDIYRGKGIEKGMKSLTLSMMFRRGEETLTHEQVDEQEKVILGALEKELGATLRTL
ncbi:MAG: phenylalanine--tRNA ligase subunit beta [Sedimentisphaerales bacterium]|nr:phenylalanine--tRNA ligase subunit beta [Sedimentisphaerales bacterium]